MKRHHHLSGTELIAYEDAVLEPARRAAIESHLRECGMCRERLRKSEDVGWLVRGAAPLIDDPEGVAAVQQRIHAVLDRRLTPLAPPVLRWQSVVVAGLAFIVALGLSVTSGVANFRLGRIIDLVERTETRDRSYLPDDQSPPGTPIVTSRTTPTAEVALPFKPIVPAALPEELTLTGQQVLGQALQVSYENDNGLTVLLLEASAERASSTASAERIEVLYVGGIEVALVSDAVGAMSRLLWEQDGVLFELTVLADLPVRTDTVAIAIVDAVISAVATRTGT